MKEKFNNNDNKSSRNDDMKRLRPMSIPLSSTASHNENSALLNNILSSERLTDDTMIGDSGNRKLKPRSVPKSTVRDSYGIISPKNEQLESEILGKRREHQTSLCKQLEIKIGLGKLEQVLKSSFKRLSFKAIQLGSNPLHISISR